MGLKKRELKQALIIADEMKRQMSLKVLAVAKIELQKKGFEFKDDAEFADFMNTRVKRLTYKEDEGYIYLILDHEKPTEDFIIKYKKEYNKL